MGRIKEHFLSGLYANDLKVFDSRGYPRFTRLSITELLKLVEVFHEIAAKDCSISPGTGIVSSDQLQIYTKENNDPV